MIRTRTKILYAILIAFALFLLILAGIAAAIIRSPDYIVNNYVKEGLERRYAEQHPGVVLHIDSVHCDILGRTLEFNGLQYGNADTSIRLSVASGSINSIDWLRLSGIWQSSENVALRTHIRMQDVRASFRSNDYIASCDSVHLDLEDSSVHVANMAYMPRLEDPEFFRAQLTRACRYKVLIPRLDLQGIHVAKLLDGKGLLASSLDIKAQSFDVRLHKYKAEASSKVATNMPATQLAALPYLLHIDSLRMSLTQLIYAECSTPTSTPAQVHFDRLSGTVLGLHNDGDTNHSIQIDAQAYIMDQGLMKVKIDLSAAPTAFAYTLDGSLGPMKLTLLNQFVRESEHRKISDGTFLGAHYRTSTANGRTRGAIDLRYRDLYITILDPKTGTTDHLGDRVKTFLGNLFGVRDDNESKKRSDREPGTINYRINPQDSFVQNIWYSLRSGIAKTVGF